MNKNETEIIAFMTERIQAKFPGVQGLSLEILLILVLEELLAAI